MSIEDSVMTTTRRQRITLLLAKHERKTLVLIGITMIGISVLWGFSSIAMGATSYVLGVWALSTGIFLRFRNRYNIGLLCIGISLGLGDYYHAPTLVTPSGIGITLGAFNALLHSIKNAGRAKKVRVSPPKPPFMAVTLVMILTLGMMSPIGIIHVVRAASAKFEITILDDGGIEYQPGDNRSRYDALIRDNKSVIRYSVIVVNGTIEIAVDEDGRESTFQINVTTLPKTGPPVPSSKDPRTSEFYFWWDRVYFINNTPTTVKYPHPDRASYNISLWSSWIRFGVKLLHYQFDQTTSIILAMYGPAALDALVGAILGTMAAPGVGTILGTIAGIVVGIVMMWYTQGTWLDESSCLWWWTSKNWIRWLGYNACNLLALWDVCPPLAVDLALLSFLGTGYLRVGTVTYADFVSVGTPGDPETPNIPIVLWWDDYYLTKPGTLYYMYDASQEYPGNSGEYWESHVGPADAWPDREHAFGR